MRLYSFSFLAPLTLPALSRPAGRKRGLTAIFGRVNKQRKYTRRGALSPVNQIIPFPNVLIERVLLRLKHTAKYGCWLPLSARRGGKGAGEDEWGQNENG